jgi:hypothetical protein
MNRRLALMVPLLAGCAAATNPRSAKLNQRQFEELLERLATSWNDGNSRAAAECFARDAIYVEPPQKQVYVGRDALFKFFGADAGRPGAMSMRWHRKLFDADTQRGVGEFTFRYGTQVHGVALIDLQEGYIAQWREYWYSSEKPFNEFVAPSRP